MFREEEREADQLDALAGVQLALEHEVEVVEVQLQRGGLGCRVSGFGDQVNGVKLIPVGSS